MTPGKMHPDEIDTDVALVRRLLTAQFPQWTELPIHPVRSGGTVYALYRLGTDMVVRLPLRAKYLAELEKEREWLPRLAPHLPLPISTPLAYGAPSADFPLPWVIYRWLAGADAATAPIADLNQAALDLARFLAALQRIDPTGGPPPGAHNYFRGVPLVMRDEPTRAAIATLDGMLDTGLDNALHLGLDLGEATAAWDEALHAPASDHPPVWIHGDLVPLNMLVHAERLSAVIDWGGLAAGDFACDLMVAWRLLTSESREVFRASLQIDDATWVRGRGWALSTALIALPYYYRTNPLLAANARRSIDEVVADYQRSGGA